MLSSDKPIAAHTINGMQSTAEMMLNVRNALKLKMNDQMTNCKRNCRIQIVLTEKLLNTASGSWSNVMFQFWNVLLVFSVLCKKNEWKNSTYSTMLHQKDISKLTYGNGNFLLRLLDLPLSPARNNWPPLHFNSYYVELFWPFDPKYEQLKSKSKVNKKVVTLLVKKYQKIKK